MKKLFGILSLLLILSACTKENENFFASLDRDYYPLESGAYNLYDVIEINIDEPSNVYDTSRYQLKELIGGAYQDDLSTTSYLILRYKRENANQSWDVSDVWSVQYNDYRLFVTEENIRYVKMIFPLAINKTWDGNAYNTLNANDYEITGLDKSLILNGQAFDSVLTIIQEADSSLIHKNYALEQYARDTGLIYKEKIHLNSQEIEPGVPLEERVTTGTIYKLTFIERGRETNYEN
ncbi:MAG: hypothetical protein PF448_01230 [Bacteroidales bacterium]|jgi:hypothetical protein|nr:hypothetical protein [Bacteroidales bacterium]